MNRTMVLTQAEQGNTNEGMDIEFGEMPEHDNPLEALADRVDWGVDHVIAIGICHPEDGTWQLMSAKEYTDLLETRTQEAREARTQTVLENFNDKPIKLTWDEGDAVSFLLTDEAFAIGYIKGQDAGIMEVVEVHAFHVWNGGSAAGRGTVHHFPAVYLRDCPKPYRHIVNTVLQATREVTS